MSENTTPPAEGGSNPPDQPNAPWWAGGETPPGEEPTQDLSGQPAPVTPPAAGGGGLPPIEPPVAPPPAQPAAGRNWTTIALVAGAAAIGTILVAGAGFALGSKASDDDFGGRGAPMGFRGDDGGDRDGDGYRGGDRDGDGDRGGDRGGQGFAPPGQQGGPGGMGGMAGGVRPGALVGGPALHGEVIVPDGDGTFTTVLVQRGEVTAVSATSITVKSADGFTQEYAVTADSTIRVAGGGDSIGDVKTGDAVGVRAAKSGSAVTLDYLVAGDAARMPGGGPMMGFTAGAAAATTAPAA
jgi:hypothetical protein